MPPDRRRVAGAHGIEQAAVELIATSRAFSRRNLYHRWRGLGSEVTDLSLSFEAWEREVLAPRLARGPLAGLLPNAVRWDGASLPREWDAYFPRVIIVVDRRAILDLFIASGITTTARLAVVCVDGSPASIVDWLRRGFRVGHRAPVGYLHDAKTAFYPFAVEPLASAVASAAREPVDFCDLGLPASGAPRRRFPFESGAPKGERITELEALPPAAMIAYAARRLMSRVPGDPRMAPLVRPPRGEGRKSTRRGRQA